MNHTFMNEQLSLSESNPMKARFFDYDHFVYPWHFHDEYEIIYVREGSGDRFVADSMEPYTNGDLILVGSNVPHYMKSGPEYFQEDSKERVKGVIIQFRKDFMHERDSLIKGFNFEKDPKYNDIGMYIWKTQTIERNIQRCYIRSGVNEEGRMYLASVFYGGKGLGHTGLRVSTPDGLYAETPAVAYDGGKNFRFTDMGATTEVVTYDGENCEDAVKFIYSNRNERIKAEYTGGKPYFIYILDGDKQAVCKTFELAMVLNDIQKMNELKKKSAHRIAYLNQKLLQPTK